MLGPERDALFAEWPVTFAHYTVIGLDLFAVLAIVVVVVDVPVRRRVLGIIRVIGRDSRHKAPSFFTDTRPKMAAVYSKAEECLLVGIQIKRLFYGQSPPFMGNRALMGKAATERSKWKPLYERLSDIKPSYIPPDIRDSGVSWWSYCKLNQFIALLSDLKPVILDDASAIFKVTDPDDIEAAIARMADAASELLSRCITWEKEVHSAVVPTDFESVRHSMQGRTRAILDVIEQMEHKVASALVEIRRGTKLRTFDVIPRLSTWRDRA